jgi:hypothetical protein
MILDKLVKKSKIGHEQDGSEKRSPDKARQA